MSRIECVHEPDVVAAVLDRRWPDRCDEGLLTHAGTCEVCADVVLVASVLREEQALARHLDVPAAGQIWWRSAIRARAEAAHAAARPMVWLQGLTGACASGLGVALVSMAWPSIHTRVAEAAPLLLLPLREQLPLAVAVAVLLLVAPVVFFVAVVRE
jgi:hypothetical protein